MNPGDLLAGPPTPLAPQGLLRRVSSVNPSASVLVVDTADANLDGAIQNGAVGVSRTLDAGSARLQETPELRFAHPEETRHFAKANRLQDPVQLVIDYRQQVASGTTINLRGALAFEPDFLLNLQWEDWTVQGMTAVFTGRVDSNISVSATREIDLANWSATVGAPIRFTPIVLWAGWVPIVITPQLRVQVGVDGSVGLTATTEVGLRVEASAGVAYSAANGWRSVRNFDYDFYNDPFDVELAASVKPWAGPHLDFFFYDLVGPYVGLHAFGEFVVNLLPPDPPLEVYVGTELETGIESSDFLELLGIDVSYQFPLSTQVRIKVHPDNGFVSGTVVDSNGAPLELVQVGVQTADELLSTFTDTTGAYTLELPPDAYPRIEFSKDGYSTESLSSITVDAGETYAAPTVTLHEDGVGGFGGVISNALSGTPVSGMTLFFRSGRNVVSGGIVSFASTNASGIYEIPSLAAGSYTAEVGGPGFLTGYFNVECTAGTFTGNQNGTVTPILAPEEIRVVLSWGATPSDLDSHTTGPVDGSSERFHVYWLHKGSLSTSPFVALDRDDTSSFGPETTTLTEVLPGTYRYSVHNYSDRQQTSSSTLAASSAQVDVYRGPDLIRSFNVPSSDGTLWTVFEVRDGAVIPINAMSYESSTHDVQRGLVTDAERIRDLPAKAPAVAGSESTVSATTFDILSAQLAWQTASSSPGPRVDAVPPPAPPRISGANLPPLPTRIGGIVTLDGVTLTAENAPDLRFTLTRQDGSSFQPQAEGLGLNGQGWYAIDLPILDPFEQPGGAIPGEVTKLRVFQGATELQINSPPGGMWTAAGQGEFQQINLDLVAAELFRDGFESGSTHGWSNTVIQSVP